MFNELVSLTSQNKVALSIKWITFLPNIYSVFTIYIDSGFESLNTILFSFILFWIAKMGGYVNYRMLENKRNRKRLARVKSNEKVCNFLCT